MVELEPVPEEDDLLESEHHHGGDFEHHGRVDISKDMTRFDEERLKNIIYRHLKLTGSDIAKKIVDSWDKFRPKFVKVMPTEYRRALEEIKAEKLSKIVAAE
jgi:glutamate synthase (NADPH/NADH) large chain